MHFVGYSERCDHNVNDGQHRKRWLRMFRAEGIHRLYNNLLKKIRHNPDVTPYETRYCLRIF